MHADVPSPIDLRCMEDARQWAESAMSKRPWRTEFFAAFANFIGNGSAARVLELGSGPGFLAEYLLRSNVNLRYVALDFSPAMHELAAQRLAELAGRVQFVERSSVRPLGRTAWASSSLSSPTKRFMSFATSATLQCSMRRSSKC